jgi:hypothetical protein
MGGPGGEFDAASAAADQRARTAAETLAGRAIEWLKDAAGRVRVEDYLATLGALAGEAALVASGISAAMPSDRRLPPGSPVFGDAINVVLSGDVADLALVPPGSVVGIVARAIAPNLVRVEEMPSLEELYRNVAAGVGRTEWGRVPLTVPEANHPIVAPLFAAYALRGAVDAAQAEAGLPNTLRHVVPSLALAHGLHQVDGAIEMAIGIRLALEVVFGVAKLAPLTQADVDAVKARQTAPLAE